jgi:hypothetical protein
MPRFTRVARRSPAFRRPAALPAGAGAGPAAGATLGAALFLLAPAAVHGQQAADTSYRPTVAAPAYPQGGGPLVLIDEGHHEFHTAEGRYRPFAELLRADGYRVRPHTGRFTAAGLDSARILVIANPVSARNEKDWTLPVDPAFDTTEVAVVERWVRGGGSLLLIADHMPFGGGAAILARRFGLQFTNGFAFDTDTTRRVGRGTIVFRRSDGSLAGDTILSGEAGSVRIDSVVTFTGQAFRPVGGTRVRPLLVLPAAVELLQPDTAWVFHPSTPRRPVTGWLQGALVPHGKGRVAAFGEAAMFSAQVVTNRRGKTLRFGMNAPIAGQNAPFALDVVHWLTGLLS